MPAGAIISRRCRSRYGTGRPTRRASPTGQPHLVDRGRSAGMLANHWTQRAGSVYERGHAGQPDAACGVQAGVAPDRGPDDVGADVNGPDDFGAGSHHGQSLRGDVTGHPSAASAAWSIARIDRQHGSASLRSESVVGGEAWCEVALDMAQACIWRLMPPAA
jgi:hypothetical protein